MVNANKRAGENGPHVLAVLLFNVFFLSACTTYREAKPAVAAEPPKAYEQKTPDDVRDQKAVDATAGDDAATEEAEKKKKAAEASTPQ